MAAAFDLYTAHFGLRERPFSLVPDPGFDVTIALIANAHGDRAELLRWVLQSLGQPAATDAHYVDASFHLPEMDPSGVKAYISHRLQIAGAEAAIFEDAAIDAIYEATRGTPRLINQLCDLALVYAFTMDSKTVPASVIAQILQDGVFFGGGQEQVTASFVRARNRGVS